MKLSIAKFLLDLLFPIRCLGCNQISLGHKDNGENWVCRPCFEKIKLKIEFECAFCSSRTLNGETCPFCRKENSLDYLWAAANYSDPLVKKILWAYKYKFIHPLKFPLSRLLLKFLKEKQRDKFIENYRQQILVLPVPIHRLRLNWRSYNQSELIAQELSRALGIATAADVLVRPKKRKPQAEIKDKEKRIENTRGIFACVKPDKVKDKTIVLIDDVTTTGSTLNECARVLKEAGAKKVIGLVVAKG